MKTIFLLIATILLIPGCITPGVVHPHVATPGILVDESHNFFDVTKAKHDYLVRQGVPDSFFGTQADPLYPYTLSLENEGYAYDIMQANRNKINEQETSPKKEGS